MLLPGSVVQSLWNFPHYFISALGHAHSCVYVKVWKLDRYGMSTPTPFGRMLAEGLAWGCAIGNPLDQSRAAQVTHLAECLAPLLYY